MSIAFRKYIRLLLIVVLAVLVFRRLLFASTSRLILTVAGVLLIAAIVYLMINALRKSRKMRDDVPKRPLGLD